MLFITSNNLSIKNGLILLTGFILIIRQPKKH
ncbi:hypothetical protein BB2000_0326 [Proteus mirabilis BB2000]|nr:hypothetical protein BB2000_0326 [Proteus mirabilis BB2000]